MAFRVSPGVTVTEKDFTNIVPAVSTTRAGYAGQFNWGPIEQRVLVTSENDLVELFDKPDADNYKGWLAAANFLGYGGSLTVVRCTNSTAKNSGFGASGGALVKNQTIYEHGQSANTGLYASGLLGNYFIAKYAGSKGDSLRVAIADFAATGGTQGLRGADFNAGDTAAAGATQIFAGHTANTSDGVTSAIVGDILKIGGVNKTFTVSDVTSSVKGTTIGFSPALTSEVGSGGTGHWEFAYRSYVERTTTSTNLDFVGGTGDQFTVIVIDENGKFSGVTGNVLEVYNNVSKAIDAKDGDGNSNYYVTKINQGSKYINIAGAVVPTVGGNSAAGITFGDAAKTFNVATRAYHDGISGAYSSSSTNTNKLTAYNELSDPDTVDISLLIAGDADYSLSGEIIDIADARKDCVAFVSPEYADVVTETTTSTQVSNIVDYRDNQLNKSSSYAFLDSGWKYQYDRYNDTLRWVPLNGDMAGLCARTDNINDPWF
nr:phage tail sheath subtilisin-like domain-containing protein [Pseudomonadota bacterium]